MSIKPALGELLTKLSTVDTVNGDGAATKLHARMYNKQPEREAENSEYAYPKPAAFVEVEYGEPLHSGFGCMGYDLVIRLLIIQEHYNTEGSFDQELSLQDLIDTIHRKVNLLKLTDCTCLQQSGRKIDVDHDNVLNTVMEYRCHYLDTTGSIFDELNTDYQTVTVQDLSLHIEENILPTLEVLPCVPQHAIEVLSVIEEVRCVRIDLDGKHEVTLVKEKYINNIDSSPSSYIIDWGDGTQTEEIILGVPIEHTYETWAHYTVTITSNLGASAQIEIVHNSSPCITMLQQVKVTYDMNCVFSPHYPISIRYDIQMEDGTLAEFSIQEPSGNIIYESYEQLFPQLIQHQLPFMANEYIIYGFTAANSTDLYNHIIINLMPI
jgi:hypothetical protein